VQRCRATSTVAQALAGRPHQICLDLGLPTFIDSTDVGALLGINRHARQIGCRVELANLTATPPA
jgi:anti-anti-sigma regulatory factor